MKLDLQALSDPPAGVSGPHYDRDDLSAGMIHIGLGNFHRAHQAWYLHRLMNMGLAHDWAILGAGVRPADAVQREKMLAQDCLTTLIQLDPDGKSAEITGSMIGYIPVADDNAPLIAHMAEPAIRIVSLTVTEGGYYRTVDGTLDAEHPDIGHDITHFDTPKTAFGAIVMALKLRRDGAKGPFTCLSCDNLQGNGDILRDTIIGLATLSDPDLAAWIGSHVTFPNCMVDCIVPATGTAELALAQSFGIGDAVPVTHERFRQWVMEDKFCAGRPDWDKVGATFTDDVHAFEAMKLRQLNAGHQIIANPAELLSVHTIAEAMATPVIAGLFRKVETEEIAPHVAAVPGMTPLAYTNLIEGRFANPEIHDTVRRVAFDGSARHSGFLHPIIRDALASGAPLEGLALVEALWARMCAGTREDGSVIEANDPVWTALLPVAQAAKDDPRLWLAQDTVYGDLADAPRFADSFDRWLRLVWSDGTLAAINAYLDKPEA